MPSLRDTYRPLLEAVSFAGRAHQGHLRKDHRTPYVTHVVRVTLILRHVFGLEDPVALTAALLHDTLEDTRTDFDDLVEPFGKQVATWVAMLSKDTRLEDAPREEAYRQTLAAAPWQVKMCKMADIFDNLLDSNHLSAAQLDRTLERSELYLQALDDPSLPEQARQAFQLVTQLRDEIRAASGKK